jgi:hypothetical protein
MAASSLAVPHQQNLLADVARQERPWKRVRVAPIRKTEHPMKPMCGDCGVRHVQRAGLCRRCARARVGEVSPPHTVAKPGATLADRFFAHVNKTEEHWLWKGTLDAYGAGVMPNGATQTLRAARVSMVLVGQPVPANLYVVPTCGINNCVKPEHLRIQTSRRFDAPIDRFMRKVKSSDGCWEWQGTHDSHGYGMFQSENVRAKAHRWAWTLLVGPIPDGMAVLHKCDNPPCVRPDHLFLGTNAENMADASAKGRTAFGNRNPCAKLNPEKVREIRRLHSEGRSYRSLAKEFGVDLRAVKCAIERVTWRRVQ